MDSLLIVGNNDKKLHGLFTRLGYEVIDSDGKTPIPEIISQKIIDLVFIDSSAEFPGGDLCEFFRSQESTKAVPIIYITRDRLDFLELKNQQFERIELVERPYSVGNIVSRIATQLRLRKMSGAVGLNATLSEMNAALRDLNERFAKELAEAKQIQEGLLPKSLPQDERYEIAVAYKPLEQVGGDWYFVHSLPDGLIGIEMSDVTGHGVSAAFIGSMTKLALAASGNRDPHELLQEMNRLMAPQLPEGRFVTMVSALYHPDTGKLKFARAGHPPAMVCNYKSKKSFELKGSGYAIGFFEDSKYTAEEATLDQGDVAVIYTDGLTEAQNRAAKVYGTERLGNLLLGQASSDSAKVILDSILSDLDTFRGGRLLKDDVTVLVLKRLK